MKKLISAVLCASALTLAAQTNSPPVSTNPPPTIISGLDQIYQALSYNKTNWVWETHGLYAPGLKSRYGGGVGAFYEVNPFVFAGARVDYVDGGFWMPSGNAGLQLPIQPFKWLKITPFGYAGIGVPLSGATVGSITLPGQTPRDNNGQATAILGYGAAVSLYTTSSGRWNISLIGDRENWSGFAGQQYRAGLAFHMRF